MTDQYIEMCRQATEIQKAWEPKIYDSACLSSGSGVCTVIDGIDLNGRRIKDFYTYLPRIEDLIEMSLNEAFGCDAEDHWLGCFIAFNSDSSSVNQNDPINVRALKYAMQILHTKSWNGEIWEVVE